MATKGGKDGLVEDTSAECEKARSVFYVFLEVEHLRIREKDVSLVASTNTLMYG